LRAYRTQGTANRLICIRDRVFVFQARDGIRDGHVTGVQTCALPILPIRKLAAGSPAPASRAADPAASFRIGTRPGASFQTLARATAVGGAAASANAGAFRTA